jgi:hypothetical protein
MCLMMIGCTRTEMTLFSMNDPSAFSQTDEEMRKRVGNILGDRAPAIVDLYQKLNPGHRPPIFIF